MAGGLCRLPVLAHLKEVRLQQGGRAFDMSYEYTFRNTASDFFWFRLENTYRSWMAVINLVFTAAMIALAISRFSETNLLGKVLIVIGILVFPVIQPLAMGIAAAKEAKKIPVDTTISFDDVGMHIRVKDHRQTIRWHDFHYVQKRPKMLLAVPDGQHAYLLTNRILGQDRESLYAFCESRIEAHSVHRDQKG